MGGKDGGRSRRADVWKRHSDVIKVVLLKGCTLPSPNPKWGRFMSAEALSKVPVSLGKLHREVFNGDPA